MRSITLKNIWNWPLLRWKLRPAFLDTSNSISRSSLEYSICTIMYTAQVTGMFLGGKQKKSGLFVGHLGTSFGVFRATKIERRPDRPGRPGTFHGTSPRVVYRPWPIELKRMNAWNQRRLGLVLIQHQATDHFGFRIFHHFHTSHLGETSWSFFLATLLPGSVWKMTTWCSATGSTRRP